MESGYLSPILVAGPRLFYISYLCIYILYTYAYLGFLISVTPGHRLCYFRGMSIISRVVLDSFFRTDSTLTHMTIQVTQLRLNSNPKFANLTQLQLNSKHKFINLTQLWLNSFESELSQIWLTAHHILPNLGKSCSGGGVKCSCGLVLSL